MWARLSTEARAITLTLHVQPHARVTAFGGRHGDALKVRVAAPPTGDRANEMLLEFLRDALDVPRAALSIARGRTSRRKSVLIVGDPLQLANRIRSWEEDAP